MAKRLEQGAAKPVWLVDGDGNPVGAGYPLSVQLEPVLTESENPIEGTVSALGDNAIGPVPAATERICITAFTLQNESGVLTTIVLKDGPGVSSGRWRVHTQNRGDGLAMMFDGQHPIRLSPGNRITIHLDGANQCGYSFQFYRETV